MVLRSFFPSQSNPLQQQLFIPFTGCAPSQDQLRAGLQPSQRPELIHLPHPMSTSIRTQNTPGGVPAGGAAAPVLEFNPAQCTAAGQAKGLGSRGSSVSSCQAAAEPWAKPPPGPSTEPAVRRDPQHPPEPTQGRLPPGYLVSASSLASSLPGHHLLGGTLLLGHCACKTQMEEVKVRQRPLKDAPEHSEGSWLGAGSKVNSVPASAAAGKPQGCPGRKEGLRYPSSIPLAHRPCILTQASPGGQRAMTKPSHLPGDTGSLSVPHPVAQWNHV